MRSARATRPARLLPSDPETATVDAAAAADALAVDAQERSAFAAAATDALEPLAAAAAAGAAAAASSSSSSADPSPITRTPSLSSFHAHIAASGLRVVRSAQYDAESLYQLADAAFTFEERIATGCFILQAVALVQCFCLFCGLDPLQHEKEANQFVHEFYWARVPSNNGENAATDPGRSHRVGKSRPSSALDASMRHSDVTWRAWFAIRLYEVMEQPEFVRLQPVIMESSLHILRAIAQKAWHKENISLTCKRRISHRLSCPHVVS